MNWALHHSSLLSSNLESAKHFYVDVLGLPLDESRPDMGFDGLWFDMGAGQQIHLLCLPNPEAGIDRPEHGGRDRHVALLTDDLEVVVAKLEQHGVTYSRSKSGRAALFCRDPDGNAIEIIQREKR